MLDQQKRPTGGVRIRIEGSVQGVGFRPWVHGLARLQSVGGRIWNDSDSVTIEAFGEEDSLGGFVARLRDPPMPAARILHLRTEPIPDEAFASFTIVASRKGGEKRPSIPPDLATCPDCLREVLDPRDRRHGYAFTNCTRCGPRYTIALDVPYDRERTTMSAFPMCGACSAEYEDVGDRRFHAEPTACPVCGPRLDLVEPDGRAIECDPLDGAAGLLRSGRILAVKGLGGYHLACDARSEPAVAELRARKHRYTKPFAVLVASLEEAEGLAFLDDEERTLLTSPARPIVLLRRRPGCTLAAGVAPDTALVGLLLPYTPLHHLLVAAVRAPLVLTSGNVSDEPMWFDDAEALRGLGGGGVADALLRHDRAIAARCDDSVARVLAGEPVVLRRGRGWVPGNLRVAKPFPRPLLACGAHLKNAFCFGAGNLAWMGPHVGDLETEEACMGFEKEVERFSRFVGIEPEVVVHDLHPDYFTTRWACSREFRGRIAVQHHHAHVAAAMADNGLEGPVFGLAWDGTGDGGDGSAWGGELLVADHAGFVRFATLRPLPLAGGEVAIREVWRLALALVDDAFDGDSPLARLPLFETIGDDRVRAVRRMIAAGLHSPSAHGAGRYFDAIGALVLGLPLSRHEGEVAMRLGFVADPCACEPYAFELDDKSGSVVAVDLRPAVRAVVADLLDGRPAGLVAGRFHATLAAVADAVVAAAERTFGRLPLVLSGGCFQNERLVSDISAKLSARTRVLRHRSIPPNDGGIALGQAVIAAAALRGERCAFGDGAVHPEVF